MPNRLVGKAITQLIDKWLQDPNTNLDEEGDKQGDATCYSPTSTRVHGTINTQELGEYLARELGL